MIDDRVTRGVIAGIAGAVVQDIYSYAIRIFGLADRIYMDYARAMILYKPYKGLLASIVSFLGHMMADILFAVVFVYIINKTSSRYYLFKGLVYGGIIWYLLIGLGTLFRLPVFTVAPPKTAFALFIGALIYGLVISYVLKLLEVRGEKV